MTIQQTNTDQQFREILRSFPEVRLFVEDLDLINPYTRERYSETEPQPITERDLNKLKELVRRFFSEGRVYTPQQAVKILSEGLKIAEERAQRGIRLMLRTGLLILFANNGIRVCNNVYK